MRVLLSLSGHFFTPTTTFFLLPCYDVNCLYAPPASRNATSNLAGRVTKRKFMPRNTVLIRSLTTTLPAGQAETCRRPANVFALYQQTPC